MPHQEAVFESRETRRKKRRVIIGVFFVRKT